MIRGEQRREVGLATVLAVLLAASAAALPAAASEQEIGETTVFTEVPQPGSPEGIYVDGDRVFVGTHTPVFGNSEEEPSKIFVYDKDTGEQIGDIPVGGQDTDETHGILGMAMDDNGRLYVVDRNPPRLLRFTIAQDGGEVVALQETYATFPDLPACPPGPVTPAVQCSPTTLDQAPFPDYVAFGPEGDAYVTDLEQAVIYRVPAGGQPQGETAEVWFADERLDSLFGPNGMVVGPDRGSGSETLYFAMTGHQQPALAPEPAVTTQGAIYTLPLKDDSPSPDELEAFHVYDQPAAGPDGIAFGDSGRLYVALAGASQISVLAPDGTELHRFPNPAANQLMEVPYDLPASIAFDDDDRSILVTNQAFFTGNEDHWAVLEAYVDDTGLDRVEPPVPG